MNREEIDEIDNLEIDFNDIDELNLALEVSSKKSIYLIEDLINNLFDLQKENKQLKEEIDKAIEYIECENIRGDVEGMSWLEVYDLLKILKGDSNE